MVYRGREGTCLQYRPGSGVTFAGDWAVLGPGGVVIDCGCRSCRAARREYARAHPRGHIPAEVRERLREFVSMRGARGRG